MQYEEHTRSGAGELQLAVRVVALRTRLVKGEHGLIKTMAGRGGRHPLAALYRPHIE